MSRGSCGIKPKPRPLTKNVTSLGKPCSFPKRAVKDPDPVPDPRLGGQRDGLHAQNEKSGLVSHMAARWTATAS